jgi:hypothetical protein
VIGKLLLDEITERDSYSPSFLPDLKELEISLKEVGLIYPLIVRKEKSKLQLVCGLKRLMVLESLKVKEAKAEIFQEDELSPKEAIKIAVGHNLSRMNLIEKAKAVEKLLFYGILEEEIIGKWLPLLGMGPKREIYNTLISLLRLPPRVLIYIAKKDLKLSDASLFFLFSFNELETLIPFLESLMPSTSHLKEILLSFRDLTLKEKIPLNELLTQIGPILQNLGSPKEKLEALKNWLKRNRFPHLYQLESSFQNLIKNLNLSSLLAYPPTFENEEFLLTLKFKNKKELFSLIKKLNRAVKELKTVPYDPFEISNY